MKTIKYRSGYKYQLAETYSVVTKIRPPEMAETDFITLDATGRLTMESGYAWDGPSGPTFDTKTFMRGSLVHDALYQLMREGLLAGEHRAAADELLAVICREDGMNWFRAWYVLLGVRWGAGFSAQAGSRKPLRSAP